MAQPLPEIPEFIRRQFPVEYKSVAVDWGTMAYADNGQGRTVLMLHGNPTWSFLYRKVFAALQGEPFRAIAPDLMGLGLSDKPKDWKEHSLRRHGEAMLQFVEHLNLKDIILVVQDWGGPIGAWMASQAPQRISALLMLNTSIVKPRKFVTTPFHRFSHMPLVSELVFRGLRFPIPVMNLTQGNRRSIGLAATRAYLWPLRKYADRAAPLALARLVANHPDHPSVAELAKTDAWFRAFQGPAEIIWGMRDPILARAFAKHRDAMPNAKATQTNAGHFLQEEIPDVIAEAVRRLSKSI